MNEVKKEVEKMKRMFGHEQHEAREDGRAFAKLARRTRKTRVATAIRRIENPKLKTKTCLSCKRPLTRETTTDLNSKWCDSCYYTD